MAFQLTPVQAQAIEPQQSVWLTAHAGTGKTKVLVDRMLRLLIEGEEAGNLLALTYTKAAAAEMQERLHREVRRLCTLDDADLQAALLALNCAVNEKSMQRARRLFMEVIDAPRPLQIQTIHSFCQSLLSRFPLEADLPIHLMPIEDKQVLALLQEAKYDVFNGELTLSRSDDESLASASQLLVTSMADQTLDSVLSAFIAKRFVLLPIFSDAGLRAEYMAQLAKHLPDCELSQDEWLARRTLSEAQTQAIYSALLEGTKTDQDKAKALHQFMSHGDVESYLSVFLTKEGTARATVMNAAVAKRFPDLHEAMKREQEWALACLQGCNNRKIYVQSLAAAQLAEALVDRYAWLKQQRGVADYQDLVAASLRLLSKAGVCEWVMTKLDRQLNHILLDEAQDTSPQLWKLLERLVEELYVPQLYGAMARSLFVVGDRKQSIYRFQGADPKGFIEKAKHYQSYFAASGQAFSPLTLARSFRSSGAVLAVVDAVCAQPELRDAIAEADVMHELHREQVAGSVHLWPAISCNDDPDEQTLPAWEALGSKPVQMAQSPSTQLAEKIADDMADRIANHQYRAGEMMVLVQRRTGFIAELTQAMQARGVPVAGADRLSLLTHGAVQEVLAVMRFCLLGCDDLSLAELLTGPLFEMPHEDIYRLATSRKMHGRSLFEQLGAQPQPYGDIIRRLTNLQTAVHRLRPYEWLCLLLDELAMSAKLRGCYGEEASDALAMLKELALQFEAQHAPHLQLFMRWFEQTADEVKRDLSQGGDAVRIMTVHGAKGLQAPLVYLPDSVRVPVNQEKIIWYEPDHAEELPLAFVPPSGIKSDALGRLKERHKEHMLHEYWRLLYVALTRAEDELVIAGYHNAKSGSQLSWYAMLEHVMEQLGVQPDDEGGYCYRTGKAQAKRKAAEYSAPESLSEAPLWLTRPLAQMKHPHAPQVLSPSELWDGKEERDGHAREDAPESGVDARERGTLLHALLQVAPDVRSDAARLRKALAALIHRSEQTLSPAEQTALLEEAQKVMDAHPALFAAGSRAEVWLQGRVMWRGAPVWLRGQIDRLIETDDAWLIVDYKSSAAAAPDAMPQGYLVQLAAYRAMLLPLAGTKPVKCALLWTQDASLMWADEAQMEALCQPCDAALDSPAA